LTSKATPTTTNIGPKSRAIKIDACIFAPHSRFYAESKPKLSSPRKLAGPVAMQGREGALAHANRFGAQREEESA